MSETNTAKLWEVDLAPGIVWHHHRRDHPECSEMLAGLGLDEEIVNIMTAPESRPRLVSHDGGLLVILRGVNTNPGAEPEDMVSLRVWLTESLIVTARATERRLMSVLDVKEQVDAGTGPRTPGAFLAAVVTRLADRIGVMVDEFDETLAGIEAQIEARDVDGVRAQLTDLRSRAAALRRYLSPQREALEALYRLRSPLLDGDDHQIREQSDRTTRYVEDLDLARERAVLLQEELRGHIAEQQNQRMYVLAIVTAVFLPLSFLTGVFGMNVSGLPGVENASGFVYVAGGMVALAFFVLGYMKLKRWI